MILSAQSIRRRCLEHDPPLIEPFVEPSVSPDGRSFGLSSASYDVRIDQDVIVLPHGFVLASTVERFSMPNDLAGGVRDKSSWARLGLAVQNTHLDPGWPGYLTLELSNHSDVEIRIPSGEPIAQIVFELLDQPTELPYRGKYYNQERGPQPARQEAGTRRRHWISLAEAGENVMKRMLKLYANQSMAVDVRLHPALRCVCGRTLRGWDVIIADDVDSALFPVRLICSACHSELLVIAHYRETKFA
jgi:dCTP deaminase